MDFTIHIEKLELSAHIGVTDEERATPQRLTASMILKPKIEFARLEDQLDNTVDYANVCMTVKTIAARLQRNLIETLAEEIAIELLQTFPLRGVEIELRKYILPDTEFVAVKISREK